MIEKLNIEIILKLINLKYEGEYWDSKEKWYDNKADMLIDIICMANNLTLDNKDGLLIIGVEDNTYKIKGVENDPNRKTQQNMIDFLKKIKFAGNIRPEITVTTFSYLKHEIDVIKIKNTNYTPYYLYEDYNDGDKKIRQGNIYTRVMDTNTPIDAIADVNQTEFLWKKRFNLTVSPAKKIFCMLQKKEEFEKTYSSKTENTIYYHKVNPEYKIELIPDDELGNDEYYSYAMTNNSTSYGLIIIKYFETELYQGQYVYLDGGRFITMVPKWSSVKFMNDENGVYCYKYYLKNSKEYILSNFIQFDDSESTYAKERFYEIILCFNDEEEHCSFEKYLLKQNKDGCIEKAIKNERNFDHIIVDTYVNSGENIELKKEAYIKRLSTGKVLNGYLFDFRNGKGISYE
jgi:hypothetical protein